MKKNYLHIVLFFSIILLSSLSFGQINESTETYSNSIEGLSVHPNPVSNGKLYITTLNNLVKDIEIFNVLGKKIYTSSILNNVLDISKLTPGIYIIKITENNIKATRKLVVR